MSIRSFTLFFSILLFAPLAEGSDPSSSFEQIYNAMKSTHVEELTFSNITMEAALLEMIAMAKEQDPTLIALPIEYGKDANPATTFSAILNDINLYEAMPYIRAAANQRLMNMRKEMKFLILPQPRTGLRAQIIDVNQNPLKNAWVELHPDGDDHFVWDFERLHQHKIELDDESRCEIQGLLTMGGKYTWKWGAEGYETRTHEVTPKSIADERFLVLYREGDTRGDFFRNNAESIIIPEFSLENATFEQAVYNLNSLAKEHDKDKIGVDIRLQTEVIGAESISVRLENATVIEILDTITKYYKFYYEFDPDIGWAKLLPDPKYNISFSVVDSFSKARLPVKLDCYCVTPSGPKLALSKKTRLSFFTLCNLEPGIYEVDCEVKDYLPSKKIIDFERNSPETVLTIELHRDLNSTRWAQMKKAQR